MTPKFELWRDFCTIHLAAKFHHPMFNRSEVIVLTNKQTPLKTSTSLHYATPVGKYYNYLWDEPIEFTLTAHFVLVDDDEEDSIR